jgi:gas vesicle protein
MKTGTKIFIAAAAGALAGFITGVLIAPASGRETRQKLNKKTDEVIEYLHDFADKMKGKKKEDTPKA